MDVRSLGYRTDLMVLANNAVISERGDHIVVETPSIPSYWWGNFMLFPRSPAEDSFELWMTQFEASLGCMEGVDHVAFGWDSPEGDLGAIDPFVDAGFSLNRDDVLTAESVHPPARCNGDVTVRRLEGDGDWTSATELQIECNDRIDPAQYRKFKEDQMRLNRQAAESGRARWYGAFMGERLVADLGIYAEAGLGRFQSVETHPGFRRQGICARLVYDSARDAFDELDADTLVIVAEQGGPAGRVYRSAGFVWTENQVGAYRPPRS